MPRALLSPSPVPPPPLLLQEPWGGVQSIVTRSLSLLSRSLLGGVPEHRLPLRVLSCPSRNILYLENTVSTWETVGAIVG